MFAPGTIAIGKSRPIATRRMDSQMIAWKRLLKASAWLLGGVLTLSIALYVTLLLINWRDRPPSEAALRLTAAYNNRAAIPDADNAYVYVMGFAAAAGEDPNAAGARRIEWLRSLADQAPVATDDPAPDHE